MAEEQDLGWFSVRCVFRCRPRRRWRTYEERITVWHARSFEEAIAMAEVEAGEYAAASGADRITYLGLAEAYRLFDALGEGAEVFSLMRDSRLGKRKYLRRFFETGRERQGSL
ncbi:hypothetical protein [Kineosporia sp. R_H_3]|uniref:hypothetical protein n=1 Tax=Kineosporia sp. R_H_3 TaxID=1961848 RepID=UPI000B4B9C54|nr:hypothetical protein [Kineosporia sp. R_H_3]